jgi:hypothetical protein
MSQETPKIGSDSIWQNSTGDARVICARIACPGSKEIVVKILLIGASGTLGQKVESTLSNSELRSSGHQVVRIGRKAGDVLADFADSRGMASIYEKLKPFDAVAIAAGDVAFGPLSELTREQWQFSFNNKLLAQISAVQLGARTGQIYKVGASLRS